MRELRLYDRSRVTTDWSCPRKRWWGYEYQGRGVSTSNTHLELFLGTTLHDALSAIALMQRNGVPTSIEEIATTAREQMLQSLLPEVASEVDGTVFAHEQAALVEGLVRGFYKSVWPKIVSQYPEIIAIEQEMRFDHDGLVFMSKPDLVVADAEGNLVYIEYKSTSSKKEGWVNSWDSAVQLHSSIRAIESTLGRSVQQVIVQGLYKGFESYGKQSSPFCYAYKRTGNPPFTEDVVAYEYKAGLKRYPTWELPGGVRKWVEEMPAVVLEAQFPQTPPIFVNADLVDAFFSQRKYREHEIALAKEMYYGAVAAGDEDGLRSILDVAFPQKFDQCVPGWGKPCGFRKLCFSGVEPLEAGYVLREPHHQLEAELFSEA